MSVNSGSKSDVINISNEENKINITYELEDSNAKVDIIGNENLQVGYNEIIVKVIEKEEDKVDIQDEIIGKKY